MGVLGGGQVTVFIPESAVWAHALSPQSNLVLGQPNTPHLSCLGQPSSTEHSPGFISSSRSFGSSGGCNRLFLRQQRAGYVYSWPGARPVDRDDIKVKGSRLDGALETTLPDLLNHSENEAQRSEGAWQGKWWNPGKI